MMLRRNPGAPDARFCSGLRARTGGNLIWGRFGLRTALAATLLTCGCLVAACVQVLLSLPTMAQTSWPTPDASLKSIEQRLNGLRELPDEERARVTKQLALDIRRLASPETRVGLASGLANLATEGDFGRDTLQEVATTLAEALRAQRGTGHDGQSAASYATLAQLVRYEKVRISLDSPQFTAAMSQLEAEDSRRQKADFTLTDLLGKPWTLKALGGKVVLVNFWATWCPPCRKELPDLQALYDRFKDRGLVVLGISDEDATKVRPFVAEHKLTYPVLLDPGRKVNQLFAIQGIPRSLFYDRNGQLAAQAIDMRTQKQLLELLGRVGLH